MRPLLRHSELVIGFNMLHRSFLLSFLFFTLLHISMAGRYIYELKRHVFQIDKQIFMQKILTDQFWGACWKNLCLESLERWEYNYLPPVEEHGTTQELPKQDYHPVILSQEVGLIIVPGAHLPGESYMPLLREIQVKAIGLKQYLNYFFLSLTLKIIVDPITPLFQASYPGPLWIGSTAEWLGDMPTPIEVTQQVSKSQKRK